MLKQKYPQGYRIGIINPLTLVGNEVASILRERSFPFERVVVLDSTGEETGALTEVAEEPHFVTAISDDELEDLDLVFFCGPAAANQEWLAHRDEDAFLAIDLSRPMTAEEGKLAVAGLNLETLTGDDRLLLSPHPIAIPIALILHQLESLGPVESCVATVIQPASELDQKGVDELAQQTASVLGVHTIPKEVFQRQLAFNLYPAPERNETAIAAQIRTLTATRSELALFVTQGTIFHSHTFSLFVRMNEAVTLERFSDALRANGALAFAEGDQEFGTIDAAGRDEVLIAEVRADPSIRGGFWVWAVCDNLRRGSALNAVLVAEHVLFGGGQTN